VFDGSTAICARALCLRPSLFHVSCSGLYKPPFLAPTIVLSLFPPKLSSHLLHFDYNQILKLRDDRLSVVANCSYITKYLRDIRWVSRMDSRLCQRNWTCRLSAVVNCVCLVLRGDDLHRRLTSNNGPTEKEIRATSRWILCPQGRIAANAWSPAYIHTFNTKWSSHLRLGYGHFNIAYIKGVSNFVWSYFSSPS